MSNQGHRLYERESREYQETCRWEDADAELRERLGVLTDLAEEISGKGEIKLTDKTIIMVNKTIAKLEKINGGPVPERTDVLPDGRVVPHVDRYVTELPDGSVILWENKKPVAVKKLGEKSKKEVQGVYSVTPVSSFKMGFKTEKETVRATAFYAATDNPQGRWFLQYPYDRDTVIQTDLFAEYEDLMSLKREYRFRGDVKILDGSFCAVAQYHKA